MLETSEYNLAWIAYYGGALGALLVWWRMTRVLPWTPLRELLRILLAAVLLMPAPVAPNMNEMAPALFVLAFDLVLIKGGDAMRASAFLIYGLMLGLVVLVIDGFVRYLLARRDT
ncbi:MAG TPA: hypothetical protein VM553_16155 [Dongiaceae bacterium]|nr:hypothetical protein [Dongiaceae bacterium]